ncbi:agmatinase [Maritalea sp.]|uniref:agmatinase n=1 Tax=Maritalea sp. TaxID=2003361 RepID=UPI003EF689C1
MADFLDSELSSKERDIAGAKFVVVPMPLERTVSYGAGTAAGPKAIIQASNELERICPEGEPCLQGITTLDPIDCDGPLPEVMARLATKTEMVVSQGKIPVTLGGEHSLTYGAVTGVAQALGPKVGIIQIDAHADLRIAYQGEKHSHASVMNLLCEDGHALAQYGVRALCQQEVDAREKYGVTYIDGEELVTQNINSVALPTDFPEDVYISFDVDGLDPSIMPATGTPVPGGLGYYQALNIVASALRGRHCVGMDIVELAPNRNSQAWDFTAAQIVYRMMGMIEN